MGFLSVVAWIGVPIAAATVFRSSFGYEPVEPAPLHYNIFARAWYYLSHRQCWNRCLGLSALAFPFFTLLAIDQASWEPLALRSAHNNNKWWLTNWCADSVIFGALVYLISGVLIAEDAVKRQ
ncbi:hypothetical protein F53441_2850 [Fusarium austroafricanum]|uniref:Uncharacterized protein n=1 Tax=Fusarium austroafricanum TaxID=2364996 RepID=A0A8H4PBI3_9HYPO|nr:hypothetical protein F53441_2850 [Fusarium austroafricanum]